MPVELGHVLEIHAVNRSDERSGQEDDGGHGENLDDFVLLDVDKTQRGVLDVVETLEREIGVVDKRIDVLDHQLQTGIDVVGETLGTQDAREDALTVEDILAQRHGTLLQGADAVQHLLVDGILGIDGLGKRGDLLGNQLDHVGVEVDAHLQQRNEEVVTRRITPVIHLQTLLGLAERARLGPADRDEDPLVGDDERNGLNDERIARRHEEIGVGDDGVLALGILGSRFDLLDLLLGLETDLHEVLDGLLLLDGGKQHVDPQDVVVAELVEEPGVGIADDFVILLEVDGNHEKGSLKGCGIRGRREAGIRPAKLFSRDWPSEPPSAPGPSTREAPAAAAVRTTCPDAAARKNPAARTEARKNNGRKGGGGTTVGRHAGYLHAVRRKAPALCRNTTQRLYAEL